MIPVRRCRLCRQYSYEGRAPCQHKSFGGGAIITHPDCPILTTRRNAQEARTTPPTPTAPQE